jgi:hypothetical protein
LIKHDPDVATILPDASGIIAFRNILFMPITGLITQ